MQREQWYGWPAPVERVDPALDRMAKLSLLFGVLTWTALPFIGAVFAIVLGRRVLRALPPSLTRRGKGWWTARHARAGLALGVLQLTMLGIVLVFAVIALVGRLLSFLLT